MRNFSKKLISVILVAVMMLSVCAVAVSAADKKCTEHSFGEGTVITLPTCTVAGKTSFTCADCGYVKTEVVVPSGHTYDEKYLVVEEVPAKCFENGYYRYIYSCPVCEEALIDFIEPIYSRMEHEYALKQVIRKSTCITKGLGIIGCVNCDSVDYETELALDPSNHDGFKGIGISDIITCTNGAYTNGYCYGC